MMAEASGRRTLLNRVARLTTTVVGLAASMLTGHLLLRRHRPSYPVNRANYGPRGTRVIRPPGALPEDKFLAGCIRCYRCQDACERGAIQFFDQTFGRLYHTPYVDPAVVGCNICMKCTRVCPTGVLRPMGLEQKTEVDMATVELDVDRCLSYKAETRYDQRAADWEVKLEPSLDPVDLTDELEADLQRRGPCGECYMVCPVRERAIKRKPGEFFSPLVFPHHCLGCGLCEEICRQLVRGEPAIRVVATRGVV